MPKAPDLKVLENYAGYKRISNVNELINESVKQDNLALHCATWHGLLGYYHHYILFISNVSENIINIRIIEKSNKNWSKLVLASATGFGQIFCSINQKIIKIDLSSQNRKNNGNKLFRFDKGLFILGDYSREQRKNAEMQASESCNQKDYYSMENSNCETFVNFCFTSKPISYQSELNKCKAVVGDATIDASSNLTNNLLKSTGTKLLNSVIQEGL
jgi:hypothetical protein